MEKLKLPPAREAELLTAEIADSHVDRERCKIIDKINGAASRGIGMTVFKRTDYSDVIIQELIDAGYLVCRHANTEYFRSSMVYVAWEDEFREKLKDLELVTPNYPIGEQEKELIK